MNFDIPHGPYKEGRTVLFTCEVPHVSGNLPKENLWLTVGEEITPSSVMNDKRTTKDLHVRKLAYMDAYMDGINVTCSLRNTFGDIHSEFYTIQVIPGIYVRLILY